MRSKLQEQMFLDILILLYRTVCVCVCVCAHTHTHTHTFPVVNLITRVASIVMYLIPFVISLSNPILTLCLCFLHLLSSSCARSLRSNIMLARVTTLPAIVPFYYKNMPNAFSYVI